MSLPETPPALKAELPDHLYWLTEKVQSLVKPAAYLVLQPKVKAAVGGTFIGGDPDVPVDATWAQGAFAPTRGNLSPYDGPSLWCQLNLEDVPAAVRRPEWPTVGVVWLYADVSAETGYKATVFFDPRPASEIQWACPERRTAGSAVSYVFADTLPGATDEALPEISADYREGGLAHDYDEWAAEHYRCSKSDIQLGGWVWPCQGDHDERNRTFMLAFERQCFGDSGCIYLHYEPGRGFFGIIETH